MISKFFIDRPVFAGVLSILIVLLGGLAITKLPIAQFPEVTPPSVTIVTTYPGADARAVAEAVAAPIELELSGAQSMIYFQSTCSNDGTLSVQVTFEIGTNLDLAAVDVQNRVNRAMPRLPQDVIRGGIQVLKRSPNLSMVVALLSEDSRFDSLFLSNYATINLLDRVKRVPGVGDASVGGAGDYAMRVWLDPERMADLAITVSDVAGAISEQNSQYAAGTIGARPGPATQQMTVPVTTRGRLDKPEEFARIQVRTLADGSIIRVSDVGRVDLGALSYSRTSRWNGKPAALLLIYQQDGSNALDVVKGVRAVLEDSKSSFPTGVRYDVPIDTTLFISESIKEVVKTLIEAIALVLIVVFVFLQNWRATLVPLLAVPVSVIGAFAGLSLLGYSINTLTLFGLVLAIGIVVDDAIIVVENVERIMAETGKSARDATIQAMNEVTGPIIAIVLVLSAVFIPVAFVGGLTGRFYQQFAVTISVSVVISGLVALTLAPALCSLLLKPHDKGHRQGRLAAALDAPFRWFNGAFGWATNGYTATVRLLVRRGLLGAGLFAVILFGTGYLYKTVPSALVPGEDQGYIFAAITLPDGASLERTDEVARRVEAHLRADPAVDQVVPLVGLNLLAAGANSTNGATLFVRLKDWSERIHDPSLHADGVTGRVMKAFAGDRQATVLSFSPPPVRGLGFRLGFEVQVQNRRGQDLDQLARVTRDFLGKLAQRPEIAAPNMVFSYAQPLLHVDVDREQAKASGLSLTDIFATLQAQLGAYYVNDFVKEGRNFRVQLQADPAWRSDPAAIGNIAVRNQRGDLVPMSAALTQTWAVGPNLVTRFNGFPSVAITGGAAPGRSTGEAMNAIREVAATLPEGFGIEWSGSSYQEVRASSQSGGILLFGLIVVYLVLAAQYESFVLPIAVLLAVPLGVFGALAACWWAGIANSIYVQIGILVLVGLAAKNAILIVEFAAERLRAGASVQDAVIEGSRLRFRPIVMTSLALIFGVLPLALAQGAGANGRISIGTSVLGGMVGATVLAVFLVPVFFRLINRQRRPVESAPQPVADAPDPQASDAHPAE